MFTELKSGEGNPGRFLSGRGQKQGEGIGLKIAKNRDCKGRPHLISFAVVRGFIGLLNSKLLGWGQALPGAGTPGMEARHKRENELLNTKIETMKRTFTIVAALLLSFTVFAQNTFEWESQYIREKQNMKDLDIVNDTFAVLAGYGRTLMTSADRGASWQDIGVLAPEYNFEDLSINSSGLGYAISADAKVIDNPADGEPDVYADGVLLKTSDYGVSWELVDISEIGSEEGYMENPNEMGCYAMHFRGVDVLENGSVYLAVEWYYYESAQAPKETVKGVLMSDDGTSWSSVTDGGNYSVAIESTAEDVYYGGLNHLFRADIATGTVTNIYDNLALAAEDETVFVFDFAFVNADTFYLVTSTNGIYKSLDKGASFELMAGDNAPGGGFDMLLVNDSTYLVLGSSTKSKITTNGGATWTDFYPGATCYEIGGIMNDSIVALAKSNLYKCAVADAVLRNNVWVSQEINPGENLQKMHIVDATHAIIAGYGQTLVATSDAGISWSPVETPALFVNGADYDFESVSTAAGVSYAVSKRLYMIDYPSSSDLQDVYGHGLMYKSTDLWETWELLDYTAVGEGDDPAMNPSAEGAYGFDPLLVEGINDTLAFLGARWLDSLAGIDNKLSHCNVFRTEDGGASWAPVFEDQGNKVFNKIVFTGESTGYFLGNTFFQKTEDGGKTFSDLYPALQQTGSPDDSTLFLKDMVYVDAQKWYLLSSVDGVFVTEDGGENYALLPGIGGGNGMTLLNDTTILVLGSSTKSKISWDAGQNWTDCYPGSTIWSIGGIMDDKLVALAKTDLYKIPLSGLKAPENNTGIIEKDLNDANHSIRLYPNPVRDLLYLENLERIDRITLHSATGSLVMDVEASSVNTTLDLGALKNGFYFISFRDRSGEVTTRKLVVSH